MNVPRKGYERGIIRFGLQCAEEGEHWLKQQDGYDLIQPCLERISSKNQSAILRGLERPSELATTTSNRFKKIIQEFVAAQTDIKPFWEVKTYNPKFDKQAEISGKLCTVWYTKTNADQTGLASALRWAAVAGSGFIHLYWDPRRKDIYSETIDPRDVIPIRPSSYVSLQDAEGVLIRQEKTVYYVRELFPDQADYIQADRSAEEGGPLQSTRAGRLLAEINAQARSPFHDVLFGEKPKSNIGRQPVVDLFTMYICDDEMNDSGQPLEMGDFMDDPTWTRPEGVMAIFSKPPRVPANNWSYTVMPGDPLYPRGRQIIFTRSVVLYDGPSMYWHGKFPLLKLTPDPWPTTWLGLGVGWDLLSLQNSLDWNLRVIDDHNAQVAQPAVIGSEMNTGPNGLKAVNTRRAGLKILTVGMGQPPSIINPPALDQSISLHIEWIMREMDDLAGIVDLHDLAAKNQVPDTETVEKMIENKSFLLQGRSRSLEAFMREWAEMLLFNFAQFRTVKERYTILGPGGLVPEDFDFDPGTYIPDFVHSEDFDNMGNLRMEALERGPMPRYNRAKELIRQMSYYIAPGSLLSASDVTRKLMYLQLFRAGMMDMWTLAEVLGIPNMGTPPDGATSIPERLAAQASMGLMPGGGGPVGGAPSPGRPASASASPHFANGGATISESKGGS